MGIDARQLPAHLLPAPDWPQGTWWNPSGYRSARTRALWMYAAMAAEALLALTMLVIYALSFDQLVAYMVRAGGSQFGGLTGFDVLTVTLGALAFPVFVGRVVAQLAWLSRSVDNSWYLLGGTPKWSPGWSIGWWFIPGANFVMPFLVVRDLNRRMAKGVGRPLFGLLLTWWLSGFVLGMTISIWYMVAFFQALLPQTLTTDPNSIPRLTEATATTLAWLTLAGTAANLVPTALTFLVYRRIQGFAEAREGHALPPPPPVLYAPAWPPSPPGAWGAPPQQQPSSGPPAPPPQPPAS